MADLRQFTTVGIWLGASHALGRPVPVDEPYPHICGIEVTGTMTGRRFRLQRRDCLACGEKWQGQRGQQGQRRHHHHPSSVGCCPLPRQHPVHDVPEQGDEQRELDARRTGDGD